MKNKNVDFTTDFDVNQIEIEDNNDSNLNCKFIFDYLFLLFFYF